jgi:hypothetical protein
LNPLAGQEIGQCCLLECFALVFLLGNVIHVHKILCHSSLAGRFFVPFREDIFNGLHRVSQVPHLERCAAQRSGSILGVTLAHGLTNISLFLIFPFLLAPLPSAPVTVTGEMVTEQAAPVLLAPVQAVPTPLPDHPQRYDSPNACATKPPNTPLTTKRKSIWRTRRPGKAAQICAHNNVSDPAF